jgi:ABC-type branched-subunit amino acid transport system ATPase component
VTAVATRTDTLEARGLSVHFAGLRAVDEVDLTVYPGEILGLIGPNGAGKTTIVNALTGFQRPTAGRIELEGVDVTNWSANRLARNGVCRTFQAVRLFPELTVLENVQMGAVGVGASHREAARRTEALVELMQLETVADRPASAIPHGQERRVGIARALATEPKFLLLDEPGAGLNEGESTDLVASLRRIRTEFGCALAVIEHDMGLIMRLCERIQVMDYGKTIAIGTPTEVARDPAVLEAYLGSKGKPDDAEG